MKDTLTFDIFSPEAVQPTTTLYFFNKTADRTAAIAEYNKTMNRDRQPTDVYCFHGSQCFHHLIG